MAENKGFRLQVISPTRIFFDEDVDMVEMRTSEGEIGVLPGHIPLTAVIIPGTLRIKQADETKEAALLDGFVEIRKDRVTILAEACEWPEEIDIKRANEAKIRAERRLKSGDATVDTLRAEVALKKAIIRLELSDKGRH